MGVAMTKFYYWAKRKHDGRQTIIALDAERDTYTFLGNDQTFKAQDVLEDWELVAEIKKPEL